MKYYTTYKSTGETQQVQTSSRNGDHYVDRYFDLIRKLLGFDRATAEKILQTRPIEHPSYRFTAKPDEW